jgi:hypothetical protein
MTVLIAFDCDETINVSNGPIDVLRLREINIPPYIQVVIVSESVFCSDLPFPKFLNDNRLRPRSVTRLENLLAAALRYPSLLNIYVSDNAGDDEIAKNAGFVYCHPKNFNLPIR